MQGRAPYDVHFRWTYGPPIPPRLSPEARRVMIAQRLDMMLEQMDGPVEDHSDPEGPSCPGRDVEQVRAGTTPPSSSAPIENAFCRGVQHGIDSDATSQSPAVISRRPDADR